MEALKWTTVTHPGPMEAHNKGVQAYNGTLKAHIEGVQTYNGALEAHNVGQLLQICITLTSSQIRIEVKSWISHYFCTASGSASPPILLERE